MSRKTNENKTKSQRPVQIGDVKFYPHDGMLRSRDGANIQLRKQSMAVLQILLDRPGQVVSKDVLFEKVWPDTYVTDDSLVQCVADIRRTIGPSGSTIVQTVPKRGYQYNPPKVTTSWRGAGWAVLVVLIIGMFAGIWTLLSPELAKRPVIAVLAFDDMSNENTNGFLNDAIAEGIITELARFKEIGVVARNSSFQYRDTAIDVREIGSALNAQYVLVGSQQRDQDNLRVNVQLIDALTGTHIWAESYDRSIGDFFDVQTEIIRGVVASVGFRVAYNPPPSGGLNQLSALQYHLEGRTYIRQVTLEATDQAEVLNLQAIEVDPASPYGYIGMGYVYRHRYSHGWGDLTPAETLAKARSFAQTAIDIAPDNYSAHALMGRIHFQSGEIEQSIARFENAILLNPSAANVLMAYAWVLTHSERADESLLQIEIAMQMDPFHPAWFFWDKAKAQWEMSECAEARKTIQRMPRIPFAAYKLLAAIHVCEGNMQEAARVMSDYLAENPTHTLASQLELDASRYTSSEHLERWLDALRLAGMPE